MNKIKNFLKFSCITIIVFIALFITALIYLANDRSSIKTYMFQMDNAANQRVGQLQDLNKISPEELLTKLIHKYVSEYFRVTPSDKDILTRPVLSALSSPEAFKIWSETEAKTITKMSASKMFRLVEFPSNSIEPMNKPSGYEYSVDQSVKLVYYAVHYDTITWTESNMMDTKPVREHGVLYIETKFKPGIKDDKNVGKHLQEGKDPVELFKFKVTNIGNKGI